MGRRKGKYHVTPLAMLGDLRHLGQAHLPVLLPSVQALLSL